MSRPTLGELEVVHHVDSVLAILLTMNLFLFNIVLQVIEQPERLAPAILAAGILGIFTIFLGVIGILMRNWIFKLTSWFLMMHSIVDNCFLVILRQYGVVYWGREMLYASWLAIFLSYAILRYVVLHAYLTRLSFVVDDATLNEYRLKLMNICRWLGPVVLFYVFAVMYR